MSSTVYGGSADVGHAVDALKRIDERHIIHAWMRQDDYHSEIAMRSKGAYFWTDDGRRFLDFTSQAGFANIGLSDGRVAEAIARQAEAMPCIYGFANVPKLQLAEKLLELLPDTYHRVFFGCSGTDAVEAAIKAARQLTGRSHVIAFWDEYHGASMGSASVTGVHGWVAQTPHAVPGTILVPGPYHYRSPFGGRTQEETDQLTVNFLRRTIEQVGPTIVAAIVAEPLSTGGGATRPGRAFWQAVRRLCDEFGIVLIADEVVTAFGRLGHWFARDYYEYEPDIICLAKGLSSGYLPLSAAIFRTGVAEGFDAAPFWHGLTYTGHPVSCAAGLACIGVIEEDRLVENAATVGAHLEQLVRELYRCHPCVGCVESFGLMTTIELVQDRAAKAPFDTGAFLPGMIADERGMGGQIATWMKQRGVIIRGTPGFLRLTPPLIITKDEVDHVVGELDDVLGLVDDIAGRS